MTIIRLCRVCNKESACAEHSLVCNSCIQVKRMQKKLEMGVVKKPSYLVCALEGYKYCHICESILPLDDFYISGRTKKHTGPCRKCNIKVSKEYARNNREVINERDRRRYKESPNRAADLRIRCKQRYLNDANYRENSKLRASKHRTKVERELPDWLVSMKVNRNLKNRGIAPINIPHSLIIAYRIKIQSLRELKELK